MIIVPTDAALIDLKNPICPCGGRKTRGHSLCSIDYRRLPNGMRYALYDPMREGYEEA
jgi:hypothetical protein